jgi:hypothetical protein
MKSFLIVVLDSSASGAIGGLLILTILLGLYFVPGILATARHAKNVAPVWVIDIFLGWTLVGWVVALAMAFGETREEAERPRYVVQAVPISSTTASPVPVPASTSPTPTPIANTRSCASCGQPSGGGKFCQNCGTPVATAV